MNHCTDFKPLAPLIPGLSHQNCRACVIIPARNEQGSIANTLDALARQKDFRHQRLPSESFEILLLLNNCTDRTVDVAHTWQSSHSQVPLHIIERTLPQPDDHVGMARRLLMDTAWRRLSRTDQPSVILSTDSDSVVADNWIASNLRAVHEGSDAVGGQIRLKAGELDTLPAGAKEAYLNDRRYQQMVSRLISLLDPVAEDPWPRHLEHFGASLACTTSIYARAGGMPAVTPLEDLAFVSELLRVGARLRHDPDVVVYTSARFDGRADIGLSHQLRSWQAQSAEGREHLVPSAEWLVFRSRLMHAMRTVSDPARSPVLCRVRSHLLASRKTMRPDEVPLLQQLGTEECGRLIEEAFRGERYGPIRAVNRDLGLLNDSLLNGRTMPHQHPLSAAVEFEVTDVPEDPGDNSHAAPA